MSGWPSITLEKLAADEANSFVDGPFGSDLKTSDYVASGVPLIRIQNVKPNCFLSKEIRYISEAKARQLARHRYRPGDLVITKLGDPCGVACLVPENAGSGIIVADIVRFRGDEQKVDHRYLSHFINSPMASSWVDREAKGTTRQRVNLSNFKRLPVPLPPLHEQLRIAAILDKADVLRAQRRAALAKLDTLTQAIFLDMFGDPGTNPKRWPRKAIGELAAKISDGPFGSNLKSEHYTESGVRVVRLQNIGVGEFIDDDAAYISDDHFARLKKHECLPGDVLVGTLGDPNLRACIQPSWLKVALNKADCVQIRPDNRVATAAFLCALLNQPATERMAQGLMLGQTRVRISMGRLRGLSVPVPTMHLQQEFERRVAAAETLKAAQRAAESKAGSFFASVQHRAFRGEL